MEFLVFGTTAAFLMWPIQFSLLLLSQYLLPSLHLFLTFSQDIITNGHLLFVMGALILQRVQKCKVR